MDITLSLATVASSAIRQAIVEVLAANSGMAFSELKESLNGGSKVNLSDGNLVWHLDSACSRLEKLTLAGVIDAKRNGRGKVYTLNTVGRRVHKLVKGAKAK